MVPRGRAAAGDPGAPLDTTVAQAILVAGYSTKPDNSSEPVLQESYDWAAIRSHVRDDGHFGDDDQPYPEFPLVDRLIP